MSRILGLSHALTFICQSLLGVLFFSATTFAQDPHDISVVTVMVREAVDQIHAKALRPEPKPAIYTKALHGLVATLGENAAGQDKDLTTLQDSAAEAAFLQTLQTIASTPGQRRSLRDLAETSLEAYCRQHDAYTRYIRSEDYKLIQLMGKATGSGVGMSINEKNGSFLCYPMPGSPAEIAGVKAGDKLISVEGKAVQGKPLEFLASVIKGAPGSAVVLRVQHSFGRAESLEIKREALTTPATISEKKLTGYILRARKFSKELVQETRDTLSQISKSGTLTLDFRGCPGGDLDVAIEFASLFLDEGEPIVTVRRRDRPDEVAIAKKPREFKPSAIILLQDEGTASAAELVIAALVNSKTVRAASQGPKTYGKGVMQSRYELQGGGAQMLTTGELIAPQGFTWDGVGLLSSLENRGQVFPQAGDIPIAP